MKPMLVGNYKGQNPTGHWISEKLDGVRATWTGSKLLTKAGNKLQAPNWFTSGLPQKPLDGELWLGRGNFQALAGIVRRKADGWEGVTYQVFDTPNHRPWERRSSQLRALALPAHARVVEQIRCLSRDHLNKKLERAIELGGEGLVLRMAGHEYAPGYSKDVLKIVPIDSDEAVVIGYTEGKGQFLGCVGALVVEFAGIEFRVGAGLTRPLRETPPPLGSSVTFNFKGLTSKGVPRQPVFVAVRDYE